MDVLAWMRQSRGGLLAAFCLCLSLRAGMVLAQGQQTAAEVELPVVADAGGGGPPSSIAVPPPSSLSTSEQPGTADPIMVIPAGPAADTAARQADTTEPAGMAVPAADFVVMPSDASARNDAANARFEAQSPNLRNTPSRLDDYDLPGLKNKVNLKSIEPWDVVQLVEFLAYRGGLNNIVIGKGVAGLTTKLKFEDVTVGEALEVVLSVNNLAYEVRGGIISIMTDQEYNAIHGISFYDQKQVRIMELKYADATRVAGMLGSIKSEIGTVVADPLTGTLILIDTPAKIAEMRFVIEKADIATVARVVPTETENFVINHADVDSLQLVVEKALTKDVGTVQADPRTHTLIVTDLPHVLKRVRDMITLFDQRPKQVFIEAKILEVVLSDDFQFGVNWAGFFDSVDPRTSVKGVVGSPLLGEGNPGIGSLTYRTILGDSSSLNVLVDALKTVGDTKVLSNPHVAVIDGEEASVKVVSDTPYAETSSEITGNDTNFVGENIVFVEVGVTLTVTPRIGADGFINMAIRPEVSTASYDYEAFRKIPVVHRTYAETTVMIKDGETIIIAGMIQNDKRSIEHRVPFLGRIPVIGLLFKSFQDKTQTSELVVFMTPRIISGAEPVLRLQDMKKKPKPLRASGAAEGSKAFKPVR